MITNCFYIFIWMLAFLAPNKNSFKKKHWCAGIFTWVFIHSLMWMIDGISSKNLLLGLPYFFWPNQILFSKATHYMGKKPSPNFHKNWVYWAQELAPKQLMMIDNCNSWMQHEWKILRIGPQAVNDDWQLFVIPWCNMNEKIYVQIWDNGGN